MGWLQVSCRGITVSVHRTNIVWGSIKKQGFDTTEEAERREQQVENRKTGDNFERDRITHLTEPSQCLDSESKASTPG